LFFSFALLGFASFGKHDIFTISKDLRQLAYKEKRFIVVHNCFGPVVRQHIMTGTCGRGKEKGPGPHNPTILFEGTFPMA
jgi:hypothetical protein